MSKTRQEKRNKIKPFIKVINYNHLMPTRYTLELEGLKGAVSNDTFKEVSQREDAKKTVKKVLEERYTSGKNRWFFTPLSTLYRCCAISLGLLSIKTRRVVLTWIRTYGAFADHPPQSFKKGIVSPSRLGSWRDVQSIDGIKERRFLWAQYEVS
jgi:hypothetical protein